MRLTFLGGADEIGASSALLEIGDTRILIDAGMRHHERGGERIPAFSEIGKKLDAIILTHAHLDHSGALPVVAASYPNTPIYLTQPTLAIVSVLLLDSFKIMQLGLMADGEMPIFGLEQIESALSACRPIAFDSKQKIAPDVELTFRPAGHILGAASAVIESSEGSIVMSGDVHGIDQITVPALTIPYQKPDIFVIESTYGDKLHASRALEEKRLIERIKLIVENKGSVIIPAFAVGRSQELILLVSRAIEKGELPKVPVYIDGMVRNVCGVYTSFPHLMTNWLKRRIKDKGNPFFQQGGTVTPVMDPKTRKDIAKERPAIVISSSGMVTVGSPSSFYATEFAKDPKCLIAISGYQDEESPGRRMLELAEKGGGKLPTSTGEVELSCPIEKFSFSAHSDAYQVTSELQASQPRRVVLVHGDGGAREALAKHLSSLGFRDIQLPNLGGQIEIAGRREKRSQITFTAPNVEGKPVEPIADQQDENINELVNTISIDDLSPLPPIVTDGKLEKEHLILLAERLLERDKAVRSYTITELLVSVGYQANQITTTEIERVKILLKGKHSPFSQDKTSKLVWRLRVLGGGTRIATKTTKVTEADLSKIVHRAFVLESGLYKVSINKSSRSVSAKFYFPKPVLARHKETLEKLTQETGWLVEISPSVHQEELQKAALAQLPKDWQVASSSIMLDKETVMLKIAAYSPYDEPWLETIKSSFQTQTGFNLELQFPTIQISNNTIVTNNTKLEINAAYSKIKEVFGQKPHPLIKVGLKGEAIELTFITPEIGKRYEELMKEVAELIGYKLQYRLTPDQNKLQQTVKDLIASYASLGFLATEPSVNLAKQEITIKFGANLQTADLLKLKEQFFEQTGWQLLVNCISIK
ncbi:MAG: MBL fold metallo-hydrolase [Blastocatellia bacterium]